MKKGKFLVAALLSGMVFVSSGLATEGERPGSVSTGAKNVVRNQIVNALSEVTANGQEVMVQFSVSADKGFKLLKVDGKNSDLVNQVKSKLVRESFDVPAEMEGVYSLKVRFSDTEEFKTEDAPALLRSQLAEALAEIPVYEPASLNVELFISNNTLKVKKVEGSNKALVSSVESVLNNSEIIPPAELAGNYQVTVKF